MSIHATILTHHYNGKRYPWKFRSAVLDTGWDDVPGPVCGLWLAKGKPLEFRAGIDDNCYICILSDTPGSDIVISQYNADAALPSTDEKWTEFRDDAYLLDRIQKDEFYRCFTRREKIVRLEWS